MVGVLFLFHKNTHRFSTLEIRTRKSLIIILFICSKYQPNKFLFTLPSSKYLLFISNGPINCFKYRLSETNAFFLTVITSECSAVNVKRLYSYPSCIQVVQSEYMIIRAQIVCITKERTAISMHSLTKTGTLLCEHYAQSAIHHTTSELSL